MQNVTQELFDRVAESYDEVLPFFASFATQFMEWLNPASGQEVLDLGAGSGALSMAAATRGCRVTATDSAPGMVRRLAALGHGIRSMRMDMMDVTMADGLFDGVMAGFSLHLVADPLQVAKSVRRVLRPGGWFAFSVPCVSPDDRTFPFFDALRVEFTPFADPARLGSWSLAPGTLEASGFEAVESRQVKIALPYADTDTFWRWFMSHGSRNLYDALPEARKAAYEDRIRAYMDKLPEKTLCRGAMFWRGRKPARQRQGGHPT